MGEGGLVRVSVRDLAISAEIGVDEHERGRKQPLILSVSLTVATGQCDDLAATFDYGRIAAIAHEIAGERMALVETFARRLARACMEDRRVIDVEVSIDKPEALSSGIANVRLSLRNVDQQVEAACM